MIAISLRNPHIWPVIDLGTKCKLLTECRLARGNIQFLGIIGLFSKSSHFDTIIIVD
jgi:hypothetical protein